MTDSNLPCPDCGDASASLDRRGFLRTTAAAAAAASLWPTWAQARAAEPQKAIPETLVKKLFDSLSDAQKKVVAFDWNFEEAQRGLLRTHVSNNWHITKPSITSSFYTKDQQEIIRAIFEGLYQPEWVAKIDRQLQDDAGGYGNDQSIAIFGAPGKDKFELVMTGRHLTIRCDGDTTDKVAFGGPIFYGHAAKGFNESPKHEGSVFWHQAQEANKIYEVLDGKQREAALVKRAPKESDVSFRGKDGKFPGVKVADLSADQKGQLEKVLSLLLEPYRLGDQAEVRKCLDGQGGLSACSLAFYEEGDLGDDQVWDNWRLEGPSFVWYYRGAPHVHVWVNIASDSDVKLNARG